MSETKKTGGRIVAISAAVAAVFVLAKVFGFLNLSWWGVFLLPVLPPFVLYVVGLSLVMLKNAVREVVKDELTKTRDLMVVDFSTILGAEIHNARVQMLKDIDAAIPDGEINPLAAMAAIDTTPVPGIRFKGEQP